MLNDTSHVAELAKKTRKDEYPVYNVHRLKEIDCNATVVSSIPARGKIRQKKCGIDCLKHSVGVFPLTRLYAYSTV